MCKRVTAAGLSVATCSIKIMLTKKKKKREKKPLKKQVFVLSVGIEFELLGASSLFASNKQEMAG